METMKLTPGAGVDPRLMIKSGKRLRNWHRKHAAGQSLREFALMLAKREDGPGHPPAERRAAGQWLARKGIRS